MKHSVLKIIIAAILATYTSTTCAQSGYTGTSSIQFLFGPDTETEGADLSTITLEHAGGNEAVEHFGFTDFFYSSPAEIYNAYTEWYPKVSLTHATGGKLRIGPLSNVLLGGGINVMLLDPRDFFVYLGGPVWQFEIPGFDVFQLETYFYKHLRHSLSYQITWSWDLSISFTERIVLRTRGFFDYIAPYSDYETQLITQPQLLLDVGNLWGSAEKLFVGTEWRHWHNLQGEDGVVESIPQLNIFVQF